MAQRIEVVRGTTNTLEISVVDSSGSAYTLGANEKIVFGIKKKPEDKETIFTKTAEVIGSGLFQIKISPADTEALKFGTYFYDVSSQNGEDFYNIIEKNPFEILPNITSREV